MSRITSVNERKLVKNYQPKEPPLTRALRFEGYNIRWTERHRRYLIDNYSDCETEKIADIFNCDVREVASEARHLHLQKSAKFILWWQEHKMGIAPKVTNAPQGYHWETDAEMRARLIRENTTDIERARTIASTFDFCTRGEKKCIEAVLLQALRWHRSTSPLIINKSL
jgi:hypothetical protein